jgi:hypothetical protein
MVEGIDLGVVLNNNPVDDVFDNAGFGDVGNDWLTYYMVTTIALADSLPVMMGCSPRHSIQR